MRVFKMKDGDWHGIGYYVFDIPSSSATYEERMKEMEVIKQNLPSHVHVVENIQRTGTAHVYEFLDSIVANHGEGVMLRKLYSKNNMGFTTSILKVKVNKCAFLLISVTDV